MAFAGPLSKGFLGSITDKSPASVLILFDDSFSLNGRSASGTDFEKAKKIAAELLNNLDNSDEIYFVPVSKIYDNFYLSPYKEKNSVFDTLSRLKISVRIKDPVIGKKGFRVSLDSFSIVEESGCVKGVFVLVNKAHEGRD